MASQQSLYQHIYSLTKQTTTNKNQPQKLVELLESCIRPEMSNIPHLKLQNLVKEEENHKMVNITLFKLFLDEAKCLSFNI